MDLASFLATVKKKQPPAPEGELHALEAALGCDLPEDYRAFLRDCNGGYVGGRLWYRGPTPDGSPADAGVHHIGGFRPEHHFSLQSRRTVYQDRIPNDLFWIMDDPFGNAICVGLRGQARGRIYFWDHECEPDEDDWDGSIATAGNVTLLANSFTDFVAGLSPNEDDE